jgi:methylthioribose-1-phosphate isomerase
LVNAAITLADRMQQDQTTQSGGGAGYRRVKRAATRPRQSRVGGRRVRAIDWIEGAIEIIDQTVLPDKLVTRRLVAVAELIDAIHSLAIRGAPALGVAGAMGVALADREFARDPAGRAHAIEQLAAARPTAVNLAAGTARVAARLAEGPDAVLAEALAVRDEEIASSAAMATLGADLVSDLCDRPRVLTHCNTGTLATVTGGTALGVITELHRRGRLAGVIASETRPLLQGARLTAWELARASVPYRIAVDSAGPFLMARGEVDAVLVGADRICANGDVVNKIGTYAHALGAARAGIPFIVVAPESTVDLHTATGADVEIEERSDTEVASFRGTAAAPPGAATANPAFDLTPSDLVTAIVTDTRVIRPAGLVS